MNIFILEKDPKAAAQAHADKHVVKMVLEACQMLYSAHWISEEAYKPLLEIRSSVGIAQAQKQLEIPDSMETAPLRKAAGDLDPHGYRPVHLHHPCTIWVRTSLGNYLFTAELACEIAAEYTFRYGKEHSCAQHAKWLLENPPALPDLGLQPFAIAMKPEYKIEGDAIASYRKYYRESKGERNLLTYTKREPPTWLYGAPNLTQKQSLTPQTQVAPAN